MKELFDLALRLGLLCCISGGLLGWVHSKTAPVRKEREKAERERARAAVFPVPEQGSFQAVEGLSGVHWVLDEHDTPVGVVFQATGKGYCSEIEMMVGLRSDGTLTGARVLHQEETPGLGNQIEERVPQWFSDRELSQVALSEGEGTIDGITGATITSRAAIEAVRSKGTEALSRLEKAPRKDDAS